MQTPGEAKDGLSRRDAMAVTLAVGASLAVGGAEAAAPVTQRAVDVKTADGVCDAVLLHGGAKPSPAVIWYPDAFGLRPEHIAMGSRLAAQGYTVLVINPFYRVRRAPVHKPGFSFANPDDRAELYRLMGMLTHDAVTRDATALVAFLDNQPEVDRKAPMGTVGYCMGGSMTIRAAAAVPSRVGAVASFHGGGLVTDDPNSPHKLVGRTKASFHIAVAANDDEKQPEAKTVMADALAKSGNPWTQEVYPGALHGWMVPGMDPYNEVQAERGWVAMLKLYKGALGAA